MRVLKYIGPCSVENKCPCLERNGSCEKWCLCDSGCPIRFPGCQCVKLGALSQLFFRFFIASYAYRLAARSCIRESCICWLADREVRPSMTAHIHSSLSSAVRSRLVPHLRGELAECPAVAARLPQRIDAKRLPQGATFIWRSSFGPQLRFSRRCASLASPSCMVMGCSSAPQPKTTTFCLSTLER
jgi:hypothetical protein